MARGASRVERAWSGRKDARLSQEDLFLAAEDLLWKPLTFGSVSSVPGLSCADLELLRLELVLLLYAKESPEKHEAVCAMGSPYEWKSLPRSNDSKLFFRPPLIFDSSITMTTNGTTRGKSLKYPCGPFFHELEAVVGKATLSYGGPHLRISGGRFKDGFLVTEERDHVWVRYDKSSPDQTFFSRIVDLVCSKDWGSINFSSADAAFTVALEMIEAGSSSDADVDFAETPCYGFMRETVGKAFSGTINDNARIWDSGFTFRSDRDGTKRCVPGLCLWDTDEDGTLATVNLWNLERPLVNYVNGDVLVGVKPDGSFERMTRDLYSVVEGREDEELGSALFEKLGWKFQLYREKTGLAVYLPHDSSAVGLVENEIGEECSVVDSPRLRGDERKKMFTFLGPATAFIKI